MPESASGGEGCASPATRCGFVALIGAPNAGKSTLANWLVGIKISIVTHKVQTTRTRIRGIAIEGESQLILVDTPGIFVPKRRLDLAMVETAWGEARGADIVVVLIDAAKSLDDEAERILTAVRDLQTPVILALNKIDRLKKESLLKLVDEVTYHAVFARVFMISALKGEGTDDLKRYLAQTVPEGPWLYPGDQIADAPMRHWAAEITREKLTLRLHQELPYASTVETTAWKDLKDGGIRIEQTIFVERESQKKIVLGAGGRSVKAISIAAREELAETLDRTVHLFLFVKVRGKWSDDPERYREMGLEIPKA